MIDLRQQLKERDDDIDAAHTTNRELTTRINAARSMLFMLRGLLLLLYTSRVSRVGRSFRVTDATLDVLEALLRPDNELYGLKIAKATGRPTGSVFPILARLEQFGWVISEWEPGDPASRGSRRRFYNLSPEGLANARSLLAERRPTRRLSGHQPARRLFPGPESAS